MDNTDANWPGAEFERHLRAAMGELGAASRTIIVALSGGADSVALLLALHRIGGCSQLLAAHCNFHLRGAESDGDEAFVREICLRLGISLSTVDFDTEAYASEHAVSIEMAARALRYAWFAHLREVHTGALIAVAHHRDDDVETALLNLSMGTGIRGLSGMPRMREDGIIRPLLDIGRKDTELYLSDLGYTYRTDSTNTDTRYKRNYIRHSILPVLRELNPSVEDAIVRTMKHLHGVEALLADYVAEQKRRIVCDRGLLIAPILASPSRETLLFELLRPYGFNRFVIKDIADSLTREPGAIYYSPSHKLTVGQDYLDIRSVVHPAMILPTIPIGYDTKENRRIGLPERKTAPRVSALQIEYIPHGMISDFKVPPDVALFDADRLGELCLRTRRTGDRIHPFGMRGSKTVSRYCIDRKLSPLERDELYLLCSDDQPIWILGHIADRRFAVRPETKTIVRCTLSCASPDASESIVVSDL